MKHLMMVAFSFCALLISFMAIAVLPVPEPPPINAKSYYLIDFQSGQVLAAKNEDEKVEPASITKLMTAYVVYKALQSGEISLDDKVKISKKAWQMDGSRMFIEAGKLVPVDLLLNGMIVQSGNDASIALAEHVAGTEEAFVTYMNHYAKVLGMDNTHFENATGWPDPQHYTTAKDIITLTRALIQEFPEYYQRYAIQEFTYNHITQANRNVLLRRDKSVDGVKTGHTESAGYCLVASAKRDGMRLISVVLGAESDKARADLNQALLNYGYRFYETHKLRSAGESLYAARVWKGHEETVPVGLAQDFYVTIPRGAYNELELKMDVALLQEAPIAKGTELGKVDVKLGGKDVTSRPLITLKPIEKGSLWQIAKDSVLLMME